MVDKGLGVDLAMSDERGHFLVRHLAKGTMGSYYLRAGCSCGDAADPHVLPSGREIYFCGATHRQMLTRPCRRRRELGAEKKI